jgi:addiction module RelB/DinJ family antitoxin
MSTVLLSFKTDDKTKREIKDFAAELGMPVTTFVNVVVRQALRDRRVVLTPTLEPTPYLEEIMRETDADIKAGKNISKAYDKVDDFFDDLNKSD